MRPLCPLLIALFGIQLLPVAAAEPFIIDGSSTVYPITVAIGEAYARTTGTQMQIGVSGTTGGMRMFTAGRIPITGASRPIRADELKTAAEHGIEVVEVPIGIDGLTVVVGKGNRFIDHLTTTELKRLWEPDSQITSWSMLRQGFPATTVALFGPGRDSGTFDYFTEVIVGKARAMRSDFTSSEDDNELVQGVTSDPNALSYFGWSYFQQNSQTLRAVAIDSGNGPVTPSRERILDGTYAPLTRPLFFYVAVKELERPEVRGFIDVALTTPHLVEDCGYVSLDAAHYAAARQRVANRVTGSVFANLRMDQAFKALVEELPVASAASAASSTVPAAKPVAVVTAPPETAAPMAATGSAVPQVAVTTVASATLPRATSPSTVVPVLAPAPAATQTMPASASTQGSTPLLRLRQACLALTRASLAANPEVADLHRQQQAVAAALAELERTTP